MGRYFVRKVIIVLLVLFALKLSSYAYFNDNTFYSKLESVFDRHIEAATAMGHSLLDLER